MNSKMSVTIGTDPEFFLKKKGETRFVSAIPHIDGTKEQPMPLKSGGNIQRDNVAVEFSTPPATDKNDFINKIRTTMMEVMERLPAGHEIIAQSSADFDETELDNEEAQRFGCDPDFCAWDVKRNDPPVGPRPTFRSCGGHIHVGFVEGSGNDFLLEFQGKIDTVRTMDLFHGIISVVLDNAAESIERRKLYGKAGCHRPTDYGIEYRALSNYWLKSPMLVSLMHSLVIDALTAVKSGVSEKIIKKLTGKVIRDVINSGKEKMAMEIIENTLMSHMSEESIEIFQMCLEHMKTKTTEPLAQTWAIGG